MVGSPKKREEFLKKRLSITLVGACILGAATLGTSPASAATRSLYAECDTTGSSAWVNVPSWDGSNTVNNISLTSEDDTADGHHAAVRLVTMDTSMSLHFWSWHDNYGGFGYEETWNTHAEDDVNGIIDVGVQSGTFEGGTLLSQCTPTFAF